jgi:hypothetical protein
MKSLLLSLCVCVCAINCSPLPHPQLTEKEFNARARSLDLGFDKNVFMIEGYSQVRRQGGRAYQEPIKFPTLTVKSPNQLPVDNVNKVKVSLANPVYKEELDSIAQQINEINIEEASRIENQVELKVDVDAMLDQLSDDTVQDEEQINELKIVEVTTSKADDSDEIELEAEDIEEIVSEQPLPTTQTLEILEVTNLDKTESPVESESESTTEELILEEEINTDSVSIVDLEPVLMEEMSLDIELEDGEDAALQIPDDIAPLQTEQLLIEEVTTSNIPTLQIEEV